MKPIAINNVRGGLWWGMWYTAQVPLRSKALIFQVVESDACLKFKFKSLLRTCPQLKELPLRRLCPMAREAYIQ